MVRYGGGWGGGTWFDTGVGGVGGHGSIRGWVGWGDMVRDGGGWGGGTWFETPMCIQSEQ